VETVFKALADPSRRLLLDRLFEHDGQTLGELCRHLTGMTRFGVMRHLAVLEAANVITTRRVGREKLHYLNPVPIQQIHDRWIGKYAARVVETMTALKRRLEEEPMSAPASAPQHVYTVYIRTTPDTLWRAITDGEQTVRYFYGTRVSSDWQPGSRIEYSYPDGTIAADGEVLEVDPPRRLTMSFLARWDPEIEAEGAVHQSWEIEPAGEGTCRLTVTTNGMGPKTEHEFSGGIAFIVSGLKSLLETGEPLPAG
jgi:uncharacterized protein YndB with AHSA1/START domain/DNA-binding transcriptional ArsR family regulator